MNIEDTSQMPLFSPEDEKEAQKELKRLRKNENRVFKVHHKRIGFEDKTLWDWLQLLGILAIPLVVAGATLFLGIQQANLAQQQHDSDQHRATDQQQATTLQTYIDNIQDLMLNQKLLKSSAIPTNPYYDISVLARARTLTALQGLDPRRKGRLVQFLFEAGLIFYPTVHPNGLQEPIISLFDADLAEANLEGASLNGAYLGGAILYRTNLSYSDLRDANFSDKYVILGDGEHVNVYTPLIGANLSGADLEGANFTKTDLSGAHLSGAHLDNADLSGANNLTQQQLDQVYSCTNAILPQGLICHHNR